MRIELDKDGRKIYKFSHSVARVGNAWEKTKSSVDDEEMKGYSDKNLWRMKQFYEAYNDSKLSSLVRELSWTNNLLILSKSKIDKEREEVLIEVESVARVLDERNTYVKKEVNDSVSVPSKIVRKGI